MRTWLTKQQAEAIRDAPQDDNPTWEVLGAATLFEARYRVPRSQVWEGSRGGQSGHVHLYVKPFQEFHAGRIHRDFGQSLCGVRPAWYDRPPEAGEETCPRCTEIAARPTATLSGVTFPMPDGS